jgi:hypothetical protein
MKQSASLDDFFDCQLNDISSGSLIPSQFNKHTLLAREKCVTTPEYRKKSNPVEILMRDYSPLF